MICHYMIHPTNLGFFPLKNKGITKGSQQIKKKYANFETILTPTFSVQYSIIHSNFKTQEVKFDITEMTLITHQD